MRSRSALQVWSVFCTSALGLTRFRMFGFGLRVLTGRCDVGRWWTLGDVEPGKVGS